MQNKRKNTNQKQKGGISLIVLVITIIVMIILAAAVIVTLNNTGIIDRANEAVNKQRQTEYMTVMQATMARAKLLGLENGTNWLEELNTLVKNDDTFKKATISEVNSNEFTITTKEGDVFKINLTGIKLVNGTTPSQGGATAEAKYTVTLMYVKQDGTTLRENQVERDVLNKTSYRLTYPGKINDNGTDYYIDSIVIYNEDGSEGIPFKSELAEGVEEGEFSFIVTRDWKFKLIYTQEAPTGGTNPGTESSKPEGTGAATEPITYTAVENPPVDNTPEPTNKEKEETVDIQPVRETTGRVTIRWKMKDATEGSQVMVKHYHNGAWENLGIYAADEEGYIEFTVDSFSPFKFILLEKDEQSSEDNSQYPVKIRGIYRSKTIVDDGGWINAYLSAYIKEDGSINVSRDYFQSIPFFYEEDEEVNLAYCDKLVTFKENSFIVAEMYEITVKDDGSFTLPKDLILWLIGVEEDVEFYYTGEDLVRHEPYIGQYSVFTEEDGSYLGKLNLVSDSVITLAFTDDNFIEYNGTYTKDDTGNYIDETEKYSLSDVWFSICGNVFDFGLRR